MNHRRGCWQPSVGCFVLIQEGKSLLGAREQDKPFVEANTNVNHQNWNNAIASKEKKEEFHD